MRELSVFDITHQGCVAVVTMNHGKANALDTEFCTALATWFEGFHTAEARAVVLTGQGKIFSAGVDLLRATSSGQNYFRGFLPALSRLYEAAFFFPKPVVAAVNGHAVAGGCVLACCADHRVMARGGGRIGVTELKVGLPFPAMAFEIMRFVTAPRRLSEVILGAATYAPEDARDRGMVDEVVAPDDLMARALEAAERLATLRPQAFELSKAHIRGPVAERFRRDGAAHDAAVAAVWLAPETAESIRDYVARTFKRA
jgi:enoyl-CoA hydratase/carnithine racemase